MIDSCLTNYTSTTNGSDNDIEQGLRKMIARNSFDGERISEIKQGRKEKGLKTEEGRAEAEEQEGPVVAA